MFEYTVHASPAFIQDVAVVVGVGDEAEEIKTTTVEAPASISPFTIVTAIDARGSTLVDAGSNSSFSNESLSARLVDTLRPAHELQYWLSKAALTNCCSALDTNSILTVSKVPLPEQTPVVVTSFDETPYVSDKTSAIK